MAGEDETLLDEPGLQSKPPVRPSEGLDLPRPESSDLQARLIELAHDAILIRNTADQIVVWNQGAQALYGWTEQEALGHLSHQLLQTRFPTSQEAVAHALTNTGSWEGLLYHRNHQGREVIVESRQVLVRHEAGHPFAIVEINRDVTERERLLQERARAQAQELAFQETIRQMDEFLSLASHELRTPVTSLKAVVQLLRRQAERTAAGTTSEIAQYAGRQAEMLRRAERQIGRLICLLDDLLDLSRIREGKLELRLEPGDLRVWMRDIIEGETLAHPDRQIILEPSPDEPLPVVAGLDRIGQVVTNYLSNALKYSPAERPVRVRLQRVGMLARVEVEDEGPGIPTEEQAHIWELFHQAPGIEVVSGSGLGLGLGLYLCKTLVERHRGQVGVESAPGQGARFWFTLPLAAPQAQEHAPA